MSPSSLPVDSPYQTVDDVVNRLSELEAMLRASRDKRAIFATAYLTVSREIQNRIATDWFEDSAWMAQYMIAFANLYREALFQYEAGNLKAVPKSWLLSFEATASDSTLTLQHLLLGMNAHINYDLPLALSQASIDPDRQKRYKDHTAVNLALKAATHTLEENVSRLYAPVLSVLSTTFGNIDEQLANFSIDKARESSWVAGTMLANAQDDLERQAIRSYLNDGSAVIARLILRPVSSTPQLLTALQFIEKDSPIWPITASGKPLDLNAAGTEKVRAAILAATNCDVVNLADLIARLQANIERFDDRSSRMALYPVVLLHFIRQVDALIAAGDHFGDNPWVSDLVLGLACRYLNMLKAYEADTRSYLPACWQIAFRTTLEEKTIVLQDLIVAVNAQLNFDLPVVLFQLDQSAMQQKPALHSGAKEVIMQQQRRDLEHLFKVVASSVAAIRSALIKRYSRRIGLIELVGRPVDETLRNFSYPRSMEEAWQHAFALVAASSQDERLELINKIDLQATQRAQKILLRQFPGSDWILQGMQAIEEQYEGKWSDWLTESTIPTQ